MLVLVVVLVWVVVLVVAVVLVVLVVPVVVMLAGRHWWCHLWVAGFTSVQAAALLHSHWRAGLPYHKGSITDHKGQGRGPANSPQ